MTQIRDENLIRSAYRPETARGLEVRRTTRKALRMSRLGVNVGRLLVRWRFIDAYPDS
jgi:hypothetical protein